MFQCQLTDSFNRCQYRSCISGDFYCTAKYAGCGFQIKTEPVPSPAASPPAQPYLRKPRWYESYYPNSRPVRQVAADPPDSSGSVQQNMS